MTNGASGPKFQSGSIVTTLGALEVANHTQIAELLRRHLTGDWGEVSKDDDAANEEALRRGERLMSVFSVSGEKLWVLTEADRSVTTVMTPPGEY